MERTLKPIPGYDNYLAGDDGTIWTLKRKGGNDRGAGRVMNEPRQLTPHNVGAGYLGVNLDMNGKNRARMVHRLVLETFIGECPPGYHGCHHPDPDKTNNRLHNLRWDTPSENARDKTRDRVPVTRKSCTTCGVEKEFSDFYADRRNSSGLKAQCKGCHIVMTMNTRDPDKRRDSNRKFMRSMRIKNPAYGR